MDIFGRLAMPAHMRYAFFIEGGTLGVENALKTAFDWKVRRNQAKGVAGEKGQQILHFREAFHGRSGYTLSLTNTDPVKTDYFPKFAWPRVSNPGLRFPVTPEVERDVLAAEQQSLDEIEKAFEDNPDDIAAILIEPIQAEGGDDHFRPEFLQAAPGARPASTRRSSSSTRCRRESGSPGRCGPTSTSAWSRTRVAFGKKTQVCGCMVGPRVDEEPENVFKVSSRINSTWGGGLTDMVRFGRYLEIIDEDRLVENARVAGGRLLDGLRYVEQELGGVMTNARGRGLMIAFDLPEPGAARAGPGPDAGERPPAADLRGRGRSASARPSTWPRPRRDARHWRSCARA